MRLNVLFTFNRKFNQKFSIIQLYQANYEHLSLRVQDMSLGSRQFPVMQLFLTVKSRYGVPSLLLRR